MKKKFSTKKLVHIFTEVWCICTVYTENDGKLQNASVSECDMKWANRMDEKKHTLCFHSGYKIQMIRIS